MEINFVFLIFILGENDAASFLKIRSTFFSQTPLKIDNFRHQYEYTIMYIFLNILIGFVDECQTQK